MKIQPIVILPWPNITPKPDPHKNGGIVPPWLSHPIVPKPTPIIPDPPKESLPWWIVDDTGRYM